MMTITIQEFLNQIGESHVKVTPSKYCGDVMTILLSDTSVKYNEKEIIFYWGARPSMTLKTDGIDNIATKDEKCYLITLINDDMIFTVNKISE